MVLLLTALYSMSCRSSSFVPVSDSNESFEEVRFLDTLYVTPDEKEPVPSNRIFQSTPERKLDLIHFNINIDLDWDKKQVLGNAILTLTPFLYPQDTLQLDAKNFDIHQIKILPDEIVSKYVYDSTVLRIPLSIPKAFLDTFKIEISYTAKPNTFNQGLFFIEPDTLKGKAKQIWTQGETSWNSRWFPTIDHPNEKSTHDIFITVDESMKTLSNGIFINSVLKEPGKKTDHWSMPIAHAPYLTAVIAGDFSVFNDFWNGIPLSYYVDPEFKDDAPFIFNHTPEMLSFFSEILDYPFPWPSYAQVVVRDYISGAMENTTAVTFGEFIQKSKGDLFGNHNDNIVAHEMIHHWFGDLVTCESWSNLALNEGFANYGEYLWLEHKYGQDIADDHLLKERRGYFQESSFKKRAVIDYYYSDAEDMFDAHSYNKAGAILHMLRKYLGDYAFFKALNHYLNVNAFNSVEIDDLRLAFEKTSGKDLRWFFDQWFLSPGHPEIDYSHTYNSSKNILSLEFWQKQEEPFILPMDIAFIFKDTTIRSSLILHEKNQVFEFSLPDKPLAIIPDPSGVLLLEFKNYPTEEETLEILKNARHIIPQILAFENLMASDNDSTILSGFDLVFENSNTPLLLLALDEIPQDLISRFENSLTDLVSENENPLIRSKAWENINLGELPGYQSLAEKSISLDSSNLVIGSALSYLFDQNPDLALSLAKDLENKKSDILTAVLGTIYAGSGNSDFLEFFEKNLYKIADYQSPDFFSGYAQLSILTGPNQIIKSIDTFKSYGLNPYFSIWKRFSATQALALIRNTLRDNAEISDLINQALNEIIQNEKEERLLFIYKQF